MTVVKINALEVPPGGGEELERRFAARMSAVEGTPGFLGFELLRPVAGETRYFVYTRWETEAAYQAWAAGSARDAHGRGNAGPAAAGGGEAPRPVSTAATLLEFVVVPLTQP